MLRSTTQMTRLKTKGVVRPNLLARIQRPHGTLMISRNTLHPHCSGPYPATRLTEAHTLRVLLVTFLIRESRDVEIPNNFDTPSSLLFPSKSPSTSAVNVERELQLVKAVRVNPTRTSQHRDSLTSLHSMDALFTYRVQLSRRFENNNTTTVRIKRTH